MNDKNDILLPITVEKILKFNGEKIKNNSFDILFNLRGDEGVTINNIVYTLKEYDIIVVNPLDEYVFFKTNKDIIRIRLNYTLMNILDNSVPYIDCNSTNYTNKEKFRPLYSIIIKYIKLFKTITIPMAYSIAFQFIDALYNDFIAKDDISKSKTRLNEIVSYIEKNYQDNILLNDLALRFNMSVPYLSKLFKIELGTNFASYYDTLRINNSMYEILNTDNSILEIALKHGFSNNQAYIRAYKKIFNELPSQTRKTKTSQSKTSTEKILPFKSILKELEKNEYISSEYKDYFYNVDYSKSVLLKHSNKFNKILGIGSAKVLLYDTVRKLVEKNQVNLNYKYANMRGLISDELSFCSRNVHGDLIFRFTFVDEILDFLIKNDIIPIISFTYMPNVLASDKSKIIYTENSNTSAPKDLKEWSLLVKTFILHIIDRYENDLAYKFMFIPWVSPDSSYNQLGFKTDEEFYSFYKTTFETIKGISEEFKVLSPEVFPICSENVNWLQRFLSFTKENNCIPEALALQYYANDNWVQVQSQLLRGKFLYSLRDYGMKSDPNDMHKYLLNIKTFLDTNGYNIPFGITAFNYSIQRNNKLLDSVFLANYVVKNYIDNFDLIDAYTYWNFSDFENTTTSADYFYGGSGLYFKNGIPKPQLQSFRFLKYLKEEVLARGEGYIITRDNKKNQLYIILYNYEHPQQMNDEDISLSNDIYNVFKNNEKKKIHIKINNCNFNQASFRIFSLSRQFGSPYDKWVKMGRPESNQFHPHEDIVYNILASSANTDYKELRMDITDDCLNVEFSLEPLEIKGIQIKLKK